MKRRRRDTHGRHRPRQPRHRPYCWKYRLAITLFVHLESPRNLWCQTVSFDNGMLPCFACCLALLILSLASTRCRPVTSIPSYSLSRDLRISSFQQGPGSRPAKMMKRALTRHYFVSESARGIGREAAAEQQRPLPGGALVAAASCSYI